MELWSFSHQEMATVSEALWIAEEIISDYYKFSSGQWRRHPYDVKPKAAWQHFAVPQDVFAILNKGLNAGELLWPRVRGKDYYFILLEDEKILSAIAGDRRLRLLPLMLYIFTHELIHIVRFSSFIQRFDVAAEVKEEEEKRVHELTYRILRKVPIRDLDYVLGCYEGHRVCRVGLGAQTN